MEQTLIDTKFENDFENMGIGNTLSTIPMPIHKKMQLITNITQKTIVDGVNIA